MRVGPFPRFCRKICAPLVVCSLAAWGQAPSAAVKSEASKVIKANVEEVSLDLIVRDKHGRPIRDLRAGEIHILDDGAPANVSTLRLIHGIRGEAANARTKAEGGSTDPLSEFRLVSLLFDRQSNFSAKLARAAALELIKDATARNVYFSVWQIRKDGIGMLAPYTTDQALLKDGITKAVTLRRHLAGPDQNARDLIHSLAASPEAESQILNGDLSAVGLGGDSGGTAASMASAAFAAIQQEMIAMQLRILDTSKRAAQEESAGPSMGGLLALVKEQQRMPGRKTILYLSDGLQMSASTAEKFRSIISSANRSGASIYAVDTSGLNQEVMSDASQMIMSETSQGAPQMGMTDSAQSANATASALLDAASRPLRNLDVTLNSNQQAAMRELAAATGGIYIGNSNDLHKPIRSIAEDIGTYYEATYVPPRQEYDGHFRTISVKVDRPNARIQSRSGYYAIPPDAGEGITASELPLMKALSAANRSETIPFRTDVIRFGPKGAKIQAALVVQVPLHEIDYEREESTKVYKRHLALLALIKRRDGQIVEKLSRDVGMQGALERLEEPEDTFTFERPFEVAPGNYRAEIAVCDKQSGKISTKSIDFSVPASSPGLAISEVRTVAHLEPIESSTAIDDPFRMGTRRIIPELASDVRQEPDKELPLFFVMYPDAKTTEKLHLELELDRDNQRLASLPVQLAYARPGEPIPYLTSIRRNSLPPGSYELFAKVTQGETVRREEFRFVVDGPSGPNVTAPNASLIDASLVTGKPPMAVDAMQQPVDAAAHTEAVAHLGLLLAPKVFESSQSPSEDVKKEVLNAARERALDYQRELPNLVCIERTLRSVDPTGHAAWKQKDSISRLLRYTDGQERGELLAVNGHKNSDTAVGGIRLSGEFGGLLGMIFSDRSNPHIDWQGISEIDGARVHVFRYRVSKEHSNYAVIANPERKAVQTAYDALVYIDANTMAVRRVSVQAEGLPPNFPIQESAITVDYNYVPLGGHDYLLPQQAHLYVLEHAHYLKKNDIQFLNYRRYGAESKISFQ